MKAILLCLALVACSPPEYASKTLALSGALAIKAGSFEMGCDPSACNACPNLELPLHKLSLSRFTVDTSEVTQADYQACMDAGACNRPQANFDPASADPVRDVRWGDAATFCAWAGGRLLTEAEYERAGVNTVTPTDYEYVSDWNDPSYYAVSPHHDPQGPATGESKIIRRQRTQCGVVSRAQAFPGFAYDSVGFRCARDLPNQIQQ